MLFDVICSCYWIDHDLFEVNLQSWFKELPINRILFGLNNRKEVNFIKDLRDKYVKIELIDQLGLKTLGGCLVDLIKRVKTKWFAFVHTDVRIMPKAFCILKKYMKDDIGIIESHREHWRGDYRYFFENDQDQWYPQNLASDYIYRDRAFSGLQLIRKEAVIDIINKIEDDYIYRNEDLILQQECFRKGFKYVKTWAMHIHQVLHEKWTFNQEEATEMQWRGLVKYTKPDPITKTSCLLSLKLLKNKYGLKLSRVLPVCYIYNSNWAECIVEVWDDL